MLKAVFFDLDGTLLPFDENEFTKMYFQLLVQKVAPLGYEPKKLIGTIWEGTKRMMQNDGDYTNEEVFWKYFEEVYGKEHLKDQKIFEDFYRNEFLNTKSICKENPYVRKIIDFCKENDLFVILSTNPIFPKIATLGRMNFVGLKEEDFDYISTYENSYYSKPNANYFIDLLIKFDLSPDEVIVFGNNEVEDGLCGNQAGLEVYMVGDYVIENPKPTKKFDHISLDYIIPTIERNL